MKITPEGILIYYRIFYSNIYIFIHQPIHIFIIFFLIKFCWAIFIVMTYFDNSRSQFCNGTKRVTQSPNRFLLLFFCVSDYSEVGFRTLL